MKTSGLTAFATILLGANYVSAQVAIYNQCGGINYTGSTTCASPNVCIYLNAYYYQCLPPGTAGTTISGGQSTVQATTTTKKTTTTTTSHAATTTTTSTVKATTTSASSTATGTLPSTFKWSSSAPLIGPHADSEDLDALKDPSIVYYNGLYHVFASTAKESGYNLVYFNFADFNSANSSTYHYLDSTPIGTGYRAAPQVFFFTPHNLWYLIFQDGNAAYSTNTAIDNPSGWTAPQHFWPSEPTIISQNIGSGYWVDMWVICDSSNCYHFSEDDNGHVYRAQTSISNFPNDMSQPVIALSASNPDDLFEASNVYFVNNEYLLIVECIGDSDGIRYFRSWTAPTLTSSWTPYTATESNPFAGMANVAFSGTAWTQDISHGEMVRTNVDQTMTISPCSLRYLYQGLNPAQSSGDYNSLPWRLALLTQTNSAC